MTLEHPPHTVTLLRHVAKIALFFHPRKPLRHFFTPASHPSADPRGAGRHAKPTPMDWRRPRKQCHAAAKMMPSARQNVFANCNNVSVHPNPFYGQYATFFTPFPLACNKFFLSDSKKNRTFAVCSMLVYPHTLCKQRSDK